MILGALGEIGLVWSSIRDPEFRAKAVADMFREKFRPQEIKNQGLRQRVEQALEYRDRIDEVIAKSRDGILRQHMEDVSQGITEWMENVFRLARRLDTYMDDEIIHQDLQSLPSAIDNLKRRLALEDSDAVKRQISQTIAQKQIQLDNLRKLENVMERAQFQLESTITAIGTVYSQMMILGSRDVGSGRAQRLQQDIDDQVQALQDVVHHHGRGLPGRHWPPGSGVEHGRPGCAERPEPEQVSGRPGELTPSAVAQEAPNKLGIRISRPWHGMLV